jgi:uncharacterized protein YggE
VNAYDSKRMRRILIALLSLALLPSQVAAQVIEASQVIVSGDGVAKATPNLAWITIGAESRSKTSKDAQQHNAEAMNAVQQKLFALGIPKDAVRTTAIDLQLEFDYTDGKQTPRGYVARNTVEVRVDDLTKLGETLDSVVASGATTIHSLRFDVKERDQLVAVSLQAAVKNALSKAQAIASGSGRSIDRVIRIEEMGGTEPVPIMKQLSMMARSDASTPVAPGELEIRAQVRLTASLK